MACPGNGHLAQPGSATLRDERPPRRVLVRLSRGNPTPQGCPRHKGGRQANEEHVNQDLGQHPRKNAVGLFGGGTDESGTTTLFMKKKTRIPYKSPQTIAHRISAGNFRLA